MKDNILSSSTPSDELNKRVSEKVASHLFLICNYNPESLDVYSDDARFIKAALNLYKFLIDAGICNNLKRIKKDYFLNFNFCKLQQIISIAQSLRTYLSHNEDCRNGVMRNKEAVERWFAGLIGKTSPESVEDYKSATASLERVARDSVKILNSFVDEVAMHPKKVEIIRDWEQLIIKFYKRPNSKNIIKDNLRMAYAARFSNLPNQLQGFCDFDIAVWTKDMYLLPYQSQIDELNKIVGDPHISAGKSKEIASAIEKYEKDRDSLKEQIARYSQKTVETLRHYDYLNYYIDTFPQRIENELANGHVDSLLPQEIVQQIIDEDFSKI